MGLFVLNMEEEPSVQGLLESALGNLDLYSDYCGKGRFTDERGQPPPDYLVTGFAIAQLKQALVLVKKGLV